MGTDQPRAAGDWLLIDLRRLRSRQGADVNAQWRQLIQSYDLVVIAPELTPSRLMGTR